MTNLPHVFRHSLTTKGLISSTSSMTSRRVRLGGLTRTHLQSSLRAQEPSEPSSASLGVPAQDCAASSTEVQSPGLSTGVLDHRPAVCTPGSSGDAASLQADVLGAGAELGSTLFNDVEEILYNASTGRMRRRELDRLAASREQDLGVADTLHPDEDAPSDEYESWLLSSAIASPGGAEHLEWMRLQALKHGGEF